MSEGPAPSVSVLRRMTVQSPGPAALQKGRDEIRT